MILPGVGTDPGCPARVAAEVLGQRLRQLFTVRCRGAEEGEFLSLQGDSFHVVHDLFGVLRPERDPDEDYLVMLMAQPPTTGGSPWSSMPTAWSIGSARTVASCTRSSR